MTLLEIKDTLLIVNNNTLLSYFFVNKLNVFWNIQAEFVDLQIEISSEAKYNANDILIIFLLFHCIHFRKS
jgi:hypothetical protein